MRDSRAISPDMGVCFTSTKEVVFSLAFVCLLAKLCKNCNSTSFHRIKWNSGTPWTIEKAGGTGISR